MAVNDPTRSEDCGETCVASALQAYGLSVTPEQVLAFLRSKGYDPSAGTTVQMLTDALNNWGFDAHEVTGPASIYTTNDLNRGHLTICLIWSDAGGNPDPTHHTGHWILNYGNQQYMNPYGGRYVTYDLGSTVDQQTGIEIIPRQATSSEGPYNMNLKRALIFMFRLTAFRAWPENQAAVDTYAAMLADDLSNYEAVITRLEADWIHNGGKPIS